MKKVGIYLSFIVTVLTSCSSDDSTNTSNDIQNPYSNGVWVVNQGNFGSSNASLSFFDETAGTIENKVYNTINGLNLGDTAQSMTIDGDFLYVVVNVSNKIVVINRFTGELVTEIDTQLSNPRYAVKVNDGALYVTNWGNGSNPADDYIAVINTNTNTVENTISVIEGPEKIAVVNQTAYVLHKGGFGFGSTISAINTNTEVVTSISVGDIPSSFDVKGSDLYVLCEGNPSYAVTETQGELYKIDTTANTSSLVLDFTNSTSTFNHPNNFQLNKNKDDIAYYYLAGTIYEKNIEESGNPIALIENTSVSDLKVDEINLYYTNPGDYSSAGSFVQYDLISESEIANVTTAIIPGDIVITP